MTLHLLIWGECMNYLLARISDRRNGIRCVLANVEVYAVPDTLNSAIQYAADDSLEDGEWFYLDAFSDREYCLDILKTPINGAALQTINDAELEMITFLLSSQDDGYVYFQRVTKAQVLRKKRICFGDTVTFQQNSREIVINPVPDAIYSATENRLYFQKLSAITSIFRGIDQIYKEATEDETNAFLTSDFIVTTGKFDASCVKKPNRKRIALATEAMESYDDEQKSAVFSSIRTYYPSIINDDNTFRVNSEEDLTYLLYGIMQRFYTTADGREKRIASAVRSL